MHGSYSIHKNILLFKGACIENDSDFYIAVQCTLQFIKSNSNLFFLSNILALMDKLNHKL